MIIINHNIASKSNGRADVKDREAAFFSDVHYLSNETVHEYNIIPHKMTNTQYYNNT